MNSHLRLLLCIALFGFGVRGLGADSHAPTAEPANHTAPSALPPRLEVGELADLLCEKKEEKAKPPEPSERSMGEAEKQSQQAGSADAVERLAQEMETFVECELFPFLLEPAPLQKGCRHVPSRELHFGDAAKKKFSDLFGAEPCHGDLVQGATGALREYWLNRGDLPRYFSAVMPLVEEAAKKGNLPKEAQVLRERVLQYEARANKVLPASPPGESPGPDDAKPPQIKDVIECFGKQLAASAPSLKETRDRSLLFYALLMGNKRINLDGPDGPKQLSVALSRLEKKCGKDTACWLTQLGYAHTPRVLDIFRRSGIAVLGYTQKEDLDFYEGAFKQFPAMFDSKVGHHGARAILNPDSPDLQLNAWDSLNRAVNFWGAEYVSWKKAEIRGGKLDGEARKREERNLQGLVDGRTYTLIHEFSHSIDTRYLNTDEPTQQGKEWLKLAWEKKAGEWVHQKRPFTCEGVDLTKAGPGGSPADLIAQKYGFVSYYAATNPSEDFAETAANYFLHPEKLKQINPLKYQFVSRLLGGQLK